jgi:hypothetical protein
MDPFEQGDMQPEAMPTPDLSGSQSVDRAWR